MVLQLSSSAPRSVLGPANAPRLFCSAPLFGKLVHLPVCEFDVVLALIVSCPRSDLHPLPFSASSIVLGLVITLNPARLVFAFVLRPVNVFEVVLASIASRLLSALHPLPSSIFSSALGLVITLNPVSSFLTLVRSLAVPLSKVVLAF